MFNFSYEKKQTYEDVILTEKVIYMYENFLSFMGEGENMYLLFGTIY